MKSKERIRRRLLALRCRLDPERVRRMSRSIGKRLVRLLSQRSVCSIALYASIRNEVLMDSIFRRLKKQEKKIFLPCMKKGKIKFAKVSDWQDLKKTRWGILEPIQKQTSSITHIDAIVLPGIAFDSSGYRVGFGKGHYDRALKGYRGLKVGVGYDFQVVEEVPHGSWDIQCDYIVTEKQVLQVR